MIIAYRVSVSFVYFNSDCYTTRRELTSADLCVFFAASRLSSESFAQICEINQKSL